MTDGKKPIIVDYEAEARALHRAADKGDVSAMFSLGVMYLFGDEAIRRDPKKAMDYLDKAATTTPADEKAAEFVSNARDLRNMLVRRRPVFETAPNAG